MELRDERSKRKKTEAMARELEQKLKDVTIFSNQFINNQILVP